MVSLLRTTVAVSSALIRLFTWIFLRWIPGHHFPPIIFTSLVVYLTSLCSLVKRPSGDETTARKNDEDNGIDKDATRSAVAESPKTRSTRAQPGDSIVKTLLTGLPSRKSTTSTVLTAFVNVVLALLTLDFLLRGLVLHPGDDVAFHRIGYVSPTTANLLVREPNPGRLPLEISYSVADVPGKSKVETSVYELDDATDFTASVTFKDLKPSTKYNYYIWGERNYIDSGTFNTAPRSGTEAASRLSFLTSSCMKPNFPYSPFSHPLRIPGLEQMFATITEKIPPLLRPSFMLFLGDFIYVDVPHRFGSSKSHYRSEYRRVYSSPSWSSNPYQVLPWLHTLDDHEIENDWSKGHLTPPYPAAVDPYVHYHVSVNPPVPYASNPKNTTYFSFIHGPASFFMLDTRTYRSEPAQPNSTILGPAQLQSLLAYLARPEPAEVRWKIVSSSVPFTKNWRVGTQDTWGGFLHERAVVLDAMWRAERELGVRIIVLSGDRHEFGATRFPDPSSNLPPNATAPDTAGEGIHEFSVGPLSMFYVPVRTYRQTDNQDVSIKNVPDGCSKFGFIDIRTYDVDIDDDIDNTHDTEKSRPTIPCSVLTYSLFVDGQLLWKYRLSVPLPQTGGAKSTPARFPPGRVLLDVVDSKEGVVSACLKTWFGRVDEVVVWLLGRGRVLYGEVLERLVGLNEH